MRLRARHLLAVTIGAALASASMGVSQRLYAADDPPSSDQDSDRLEEVIVTAERRTEDIQKTAASVDVRSGDDLTKEGRFTLQQVLEDVPGVTVVPPNGGGAPGSGDSAGTSIIIRGAVPNTASAGNAVVPTTAVYTDGVYSGIGGGYDIARVEVLRGPQGTLYGRSATAGVVATYTHNPELGKFSADGTAEFGSYDLNHDTAVVNIPVGDQIAVRAAGNYYSREGFISSEGGYSKSTDGKIKALYKPNDNFSLLVGAGLESTYPNSGGTTLSLTPPGAFNPATIPHPTANTTYNVGGAVAGGAVSRIHQVWAELNLNLGFGTLTYLPAYRSYYQNGLTLGQGPAGPNGVRFPLASVILEPSDKFITHEVRIASASDSKLIWQVGGLYYDNSYNNINESYVDTTGDPLIFNSNVRKLTTDTGAFGEATLPFGDGTWRATLGLRYDHTKVTGTELYTVASNPFGLAPVPNVISSLTLPPGAGDSAFNNATFKARIEKDLFPANLLYAMVSTGFLPGDVQVTTVGAGPNVTAGAVRYDQEKLTAYEVGSKNRFLEDTIQVNGDLFYYTYTGYQASTLTSPFNPSFAIVTSPAKMYGAELDAAYQFTQHDRVGFTYAYTDARFVNEPSCPGSTTTVCFAQAIANTTIPDIPPVTITANYDHRLRLAGGSSLDFYADARYTSAYDATYYLPVYVDYEPYAHVDGQWVGDLSVSWSSSNDKYAVTAYVRNVGNNDYKNGAQLSGLGTTFSATGTRYDPRTLGVIVHVGL